jgi:DNA-binding NarL/FixJ family response regulator
MQEPLQTKPKVVVADDNPAFLKKMTSLLERDFDVVATAADGQSALDLISRFKPEVAVLDFQMPALNGLEVTRELAKDLNHPHVVICSLETDADLVQAAHAAGAIGYVFKSRIASDLVSTVRSAIEAPVCC